MVERPLSMREVPGSMLGFANSLHDFTIANMQLYFFLKGLFPDHCFKNNNVQTFYLGNLL